MKAPLAIATVMLVGVIGTGRIGALFEQDSKREKPATHLGAWLVLGASIVVAEPVEKRREAVKSQYSIEGAYADYQEMLKDHDFDVISVATPVETHEEIVTSIAKVRGAKVIFCEKPIAPTVRAASAMVRACKAADIKLAINHTRRWEPAWRHIKSVYIESGPLGKVIGSTAYFSSDIVDTGTHMADIVNWYGLTGQKAHVVNLKEIEYLIFEVDIIFQQGRVRVIDNGREIELWQATPSFHYEYFNELQRFMIDLPKTKATPMLAACEQLRACARGEDEEPYCTGTDGMLALQRALLWKEFSEGWKE